MNIVHALKVAIGGLAILGSASASPTFAADAAGKYSVRGVGGARCDAVVAAFTAKNTPAVESYVSWMLGYASAYNHVVSGTFDAIPTKDGRDLVSLVLGLCQSNAAIQLETSTFRVLRAVANLRLTGETPLVTLTSDGKSFELRQETVRLVQGRLKALKLYNGAENGETNPQLIAALKAYQTSQKLPATGLPDISLLIRLFRDK